MTFGEKKMNATNEKYKKHTLENIAEKYYYIYGVATNEDRSVPCDIDGLKPVARRILWAAYSMGSRSNAKFVKAARIVGETMGKFHPHGNMAIYSTMVNMVNSTTPTLEGQGNWGTLSDPTPAAERYTETRLSKYAEKVFFDPFYLPTIDYIPNYDGNNQEPLILPALLPNLLLNGTFGIGVGVSTSIPTYDKKSLEKLLLNALEKGKKIDAKSCAKTLEFTYKYGGTPLPDPEEMKKFYTTGKGKVMYNSIYSVDEKKNIMTLTKFAPIQGFVKPLEKCLALPNVAKANDVTDRKTKTPTIQIDFKKGISENLREKVVEKIDSFFSASESYDVKITVRERDEEGNPVIKLSNSTIPDMLNNWLNYRIELERKACDYWKGKAQERIAHLELLQKAVINRALILKALDKKCSESELEDYLAAEMKITKEQAKTILDIPVRKLRALENDNLIKGIKEKKDEVKQLENRKKEPNPHIADNIKKLVSLI